MPSPMIETLRRSANLNEWVEEEIRDDPGCALTRNPQKEREEHLADADRLRELADIFANIDRLDHPLDEPGVPEPGCECSGCRLARLLAKGDDRGDK